jgi:phage gp36-like protein
MSYATWQDLAARYKKAAEMVDAEEAALGFIDGAEADVNARLAVRYTVPFDPTPPAVKDIVIDLAWYKMTWEQQTSDKLYEYINKRLDALACGSATLVSSTGVIATNDVLPWSDMQDRRTVFGIDDPINYSVSNEWLNDEAEERNND